MTLAVLTAALVFSTTFRPEVGPATCKLEFPQLSDQSMSIYLPAFLPPSFQVLIETRSTFQHSNSSARLHSSHLGMSYGIQLYKVRIQPLTYIPCRGCHFPLYQPAAAVVNENFLDSLFTLAYVRSQVSNFYPAHSCSQPYSQLMTISSLIPAQTWHINSQADIFRDI